MDLSNDNIIHIRKGNVEFLQFRRLLQYNDIINHAYTLIPDNMDYRVDTIVSEDIFQRNVLNYKKMCETIELNYKNLVRPMITHSDNVKIIAEKQNKDFPDFKMESLNEVDGLITAKKDLILVSTNADCNIFMFFDPIKRVIANVHSGWRGTLKRIGVKAINKMVSEKGCNPDDIICCICPTIRSCHFEVGNDVKELFEKEFSKTMELTDIIVNGDKDGKYYIDSVKINKILFEKVGLKKENIIDSNICSMCNKELIHSYRIEGKDFGTNAALITLK